MQAFARAIQAAKSIRTWRLDPDGQNGTFADYAIGAPGKILAFSLESLKEYKRIRRAKRAGDFEPFY